MRKVTVIKQFRDKVDHKTIYRPGQTVNDFSEERIANLMSRGFVKVEEVVEPRTIFGEINLEKSANDIKEAIEKTEDIALLQEALAGEMGDKNRKGVTQMLQDRIDELTRAENEAINAIKALGDISALKEILNAENAKVIPNAKIIQAAKDRIIELT